ncbi:MAG: tRNA epoxyqueuosine(34) reductase QueG [Phycisphaeraceae bacterium]
MSSRRDRVVELASPFGFALVGIAPAKPSRHSDFVRAWVAKGSHGEMAYLADHLDVRLDPGKLLAGAESVICVADRHHTEAHRAPEGRPPHGRIARYAFGRDYHKIIKKRLHQLADRLKEHYPDERFRCTVDTAPILEREYAALARLGWIGKHTLLIHPRIGSYLLMGTIVTTLKLVDDDATCPDLPEPDHCGTCTRCIDACPTQCISRSGPRALDASRCISYLTIEHRSPIDPALHPLMGDWIAGCDVCQEVCPHNRERADEIERDMGDASQRSPRGFCAPLAVGYHPDYTPRPPAPGISLLDILDWSEDDRRSAFQGSALKRIKLDMLKRNALIALSNSPVFSRDASIRERVRQLANDATQPELVRVTARQVLDRLAADNG